MRNASGHQCKVKMSGSERKSDLENVGHFLRKTCSRERQRQRNVQKKCAARAKLLFC